uniref:Uncharacterized protein n=1 Tax=Anguilla anguilla TaxID=7936 RepID=A0A0E9TBQ1_ANGAN
MNKQSVAKETVRGEETKEGAEKTGYRN